MNSAISTIGCLVFLWLGGSQALAGEEKSPARSTRIIDGRREPHLLPEYAVWEGLFAALHDFTGGKSDPSDPKVKSFIEGNLFISPADTKILLEGVGQARTRIRAATHRLGNTLDGDVSAETISEARREFSRSVLACRDELLSRLSPLGAKALLRYADLLKQGMNHEDAE